MKQLIKNSIKKTIEIFRRFRMKDNILCFKHNNKRIYFYLPRKGDYIPQQILFRNTFYEKKTLKKISRFVDDNFTFLDIGSNIGNHIIYFTKILKAKKVYGFEPQKDVFQTLKKNIEINDISEQVEIFNMGLGINNTNATIKDKYSYNSGATTIKIDNEGDIKMNSIDRLDIEDKIDFIKMDIEGFEKQALIGGINTIRKNLPIVWVEISQDKDFILNYFRYLKYDDPIKLDDSGNYLFINNSSNESKEDKK